MTQGIRPLSRDRDLARVEAFYARAADYVRLETGLEPDAATARDFFDAAPPGRSPESALRSGLFQEGRLEERLEGIAELAFGYPEAQDAFLGLLLLAPEARGQGLGRRFLDHLIGQAQAQRAARLYLAVLDANPRGRAFWEREGFVRVMTSEPDWTGNKLHVRHRMMRRIA